LNELRGIIAATRTSVLERCSKVSWRPLSPCSAPSICLLPLATRPALAGRGVLLYYLRVLYRLLANAVVAFHGLFILFVVLGGFLAWRWRWVAAVHIPCASWGILIEYRGGICPLTPLENSLRARAGQH